MDVDADIANPDHAQIFRARTLFEIPRAARGVMRLSHFQASIVLTLVISIGLCFGLARIEIDASIGTMLISGDPAYAAHAEHKSWFGSDEVLSIAIPFRDSLSGEALQIQKRVTTSLEGIEGVVQVTALTTQDDVVGSDDGLDVSPLVPEDFLNLGKAWPEELKSRVQENSIWTGWLVSESLGAVAMQVRLDDSEHGEITRGDTMSRIEAVLNLELGDR